MDKINLADKLPFWHFDEDLMVYSDGSLGHGFVLTGKDISSAEVSEINSFNQSLKNLLLSVKKGYKLQIFYRMTPNAKKIIDEHEELMGNESKLYQPVKNARIIFFRQNQKAGNYFVPEVYFFVRSGPYSYKRQGLFKSTQKFQEMTLEEYEKHKKNFLKERKKMKNLLENCGLKPESLSRDSWFALLFEYFNLSRAEKIGIPKFRDDAQVV